MSPKSPGYRPILLLLLACASATPVGVGAAEWPDGRKIAVTLTFDLDADTLWWDDPDSMQGNPSSLSQGRYGPTVAVPKILALLERHGIRATFFVPSWVAGQYPETLRAIASAGHEIGAHGVKHVAPVTLSAAAEQAEFAESVRVLEAITGKRPRGYRAPSWALSDITLELAVDAGFTYSSNLMDSDVPYVHDSPPGLVELPVSWILDDAPYFWFDEASWDKKIHSAAEVRAIWQEEFVAAYESGGYFDLTMHPQIIGRPARVRMLDELVDWMSDFDGVWFATCAEVANHVRSIEAR
ncbi:MAG: polysaccharide deacetylase [Gammaproteobacteria bacterium]|nr:polysaccharide deacetylase [Gammaproteobacteria bacterium]MDH4256700.1 polysaccharide deacetylase [Gammaproteobacteria bacterium]MDH5311370.1 polysaccharide deacetylase [Gammaproteobacteria bacterium]